MVERRTSNRPYAARTGSRR